MTIHLIIGASGQVGQHLMKAVFSAGLIPVGTYHHYAMPGLQPLNICNPVEVRSFFATLGPAVVYLSASLTNVDYCELQPEAGFLVNVVGVRNVVEAANHCQALLVYFSSDYIFDGKAGPYAEDDLANPICEYGRQKLLAEHYVALHAHSYLIIRTTVVYGWESQGKNFIYRLRDALTKGQTLPVPVDQIGSPTYAPNLAQATIELAARKAGGLYHLVGPDRVNRYEFAREAATVFGLDADLILPVPTKSLGQVASRPLNAGMRVDKAAAFLRTSLLNYRDGLRIMAAKGEE